MAIKLKQAQQSSTRTVNFKFRLGDGSEVDMRAVYETTSIKEMKERLAEATKRAKDNPDDVVWLSDNLINQYKLMALPDIVDDNEKPIKLTSEILESFEVYNLNAIKSAIEGDLNPKSK